jgi:hypothetical protein
MHYTNLATPHPTELYRTMPRLTEKDMAVVFFTSAKDHNDILFVIRICKGLDNGLFMDAGHKRP